MARFAICFGDVVVGDGSTEDKARTDAYHQGQTVEDLEGAEVVEYDADAKEVRMQGGVVCICNKGYR